MALFNDAKDLILKGDLNFETASLRVILKSGVPVDPTGGTVNVGLIDPNDIVADQSLNNKQLVPGADPQDLNFVADDLVFASLQGLPITQVLIYKAGVTPALSPLIWERRATYTPDGTDLALEWGSYVFQVANELGNDFYWSGKRDLFQGQIDLENDDIRAVLVDGSYTPDRVAHTVLADIPPVNRIGFEYAIPDRVVGAPLLSSGVLDADDIVIPSLPAGNDVELIALIKYDNIAPEDSKLIGYLTEGMNLPYTPSGGVAGIIWSNQPHRIICLDA
jgi:hypothetical protein